MNNLCVAHRGFSYKSPENTIAAINMAIAEPYVQWIEIDTQLSSDGIPVVIHDFSLDRTTNGTGLVKDHTWEQLQSLDAGRWKGVAFIGEKIPSLDEVLKLSRGRIRLNIELKTKGDMYIGLEKAVLERISYYHMENEVVLTSFDENALRRVKDYNVKINTGLIINNRPIDLMKRLKDLKCSFLSIKASYLNSALTSTLISQGITVMAWTVDNASGMKRLSSMNSGIMICTNRPDVWAATLLNNKPYFWQKIFHKKE
ncbi:glycerophosphodiester phosphodiesterase [Paenibacillus crassostreae]|uniref:Glycerophosphodiester phosphodiesterase n=1 Tax=Paenibacillus crassostreae TaxID=1763538 RepID=A0A167FXW0_9BACL|nr:glycerophosphodiester phosphodiesterase family protein [Paenibacillus crassostreae]AOZ93960.1 glycerophosphodiester phosphodiesterase [Paenibacillus crassostreae]OAB77007.1 glycerophosphodiester phosphodiesterase [Paenibacillus crassostreae]